MHILNLYTAIKHIYSYLLISQIFPPNPKSSLPPKIFGFGFLPPSIKFIKKLAGPYGMKEALHGYGDSFPHSKGQPEN